MPRRTPPHRPARVATRTTSPPRPRRVAFYAALIAASLGAIASLAARAQPPAYGDAFNARWHDGRAELASYDLTYPRYGELRSGTAATVTVTEPFDAAQRVKSDRGGAGSFGVIKLNLAEDFTTGVYDYNLMTSAFVATQPAAPLAAGDVAKVSFSSQEWCGQVWQQAAFRPVAQPNDLCQTTHSYFQSEGDRQTDLPHPEGGFAEDALILWARGLAGPRVNPGQTLRVPLYRSMAIQRLQHVPAAWDTATLTRESATRATATVASDAGARTYRFTLRPDGVLESLERSDGYALHLRKASRMPYWNQNRNADQKRLGNIGLTPRVPGQM